MPNEPKPETLPAGNTPAVSTPPVSSPEPKNAPAPVAPAATEPKPAETTPPKIDAKEVMASLTADQRRDLVLGRKPSGLPEKAPEPTPAPAPEPTPEPAPAKEAATPTPEPKADPAPEPKPADNEDDPPLPDRFRFADSDDRMVALYAKRNKVSLKEATRILFPDEAPAPATKADDKGKPADAPEPAPDPVAELDEQIATLSAQRKQLREDLDNDKADEISDQIADLRAAKRIAEAEAQRTAATQAQTVEQQVAASRDRAYQEFPMLGEETSPHRFGLIGFISVEQNNPSRKAFFQRPDWPEQIAREYAERQGLTSGAANPEGTPPATPPAAPVAPAKPAPAVIRKTQPQQVDPGARLLTSAGGASTPAPRVLTPQEAIAEARTDPELRAALNKAVWAAQNQRKSA